MPSESHPWPAQRIRAFRRAILEFFREQRRELPWREAPTPYGTLVSEVMLQQTRVETVVPYYLRWMERFPGPEALAAAQEEEVLRMWQGLGYYSRARNLLRAVREVVQDHGGVVPRDPGILRRLPGVGAYTAGAVASIAYGEREPAVDGNVRRVLCRLLDVPDPTARQLEGWARAMVDPDRAGDFNQALMELGATVCTPRSPGCPGCPVAVYCRARETGMVQDRPAPRTRRPSPHVVEAVTVLVRWPGMGSAAGSVPVPETAAVLLQRRPDHGLLAGMWECPGREVPPGHDPGAVALELARELQPGTDGGFTGHAGGAPKERTPGGIPLSPVDHAFSHRKVGYRPYLFLLPPGEKRGTGARRAEGRRWLRFGDLDQVPLPAAQVRILRQAKGRVHEELRPRGAGAEPAP